MLNKWTVSTVVNMVDDLQDVKLPERMTVAELKVWLESKGAPTKGKKRDLIDRQAE